MPAATRVYDFINSLAVNTHLGFGGVYGSPANVISDLGYLGIRHVRDAADYGTGPLATLGQAGIGINLLESAGSDNVGQATALAPYLVSWEGPNEVNFSSLSVSQVRGYQQGIWDTIHSTPSLSAVKSVCFSVASSSGSDFSQYGDVSAWCDFACSHVYFGGGAQPYQPLVDFGIQLAALCCPNRPDFVTETGYTTATFQQGGNQAVSQNVAMRDTLNMYMDCWLLGYKRTFKYELYDEGADGAQESSYGFFYNDRSHKPVATAMHNLTTILADAGGTASSFTVGSLNYSLTNLPGNGHSLLLQKSSGEFWVSVWAEPTNWNQSTLTDVTPPTVAVTLNLGASFSTIQVFDPIVGTAAQQTLSNVSSVSLSITDHPLLVSVAGSPPSGAGSIFISGSGGFIRSPSGGIIYR